jgi:hypothetical protein
MKIPSFVVAALIVFASPLVCAEIVGVDGNMAVRDSAVDHPARGSTMQTVESHFGAPSNKHAAVGKPAITRWDYPGFSVFFENDRVIHAVIVAG